MHYNIIITSAPVIIHQIITQIKTIFITKVDCLVVDYLASLIFTIYNILMLFSSQSDAFLHFLTNIKYQVFKISTSLPYL